jgi:hypothetical protein
MLATWQHLLRTPDLLTAAGSITAFTPAAIAQLRKKYPADLVHAAIDLVTARRKAADKFPGLAERMVADPTGVEQSSSLDVARHKAARFADLKLPGVADLCCGIGGDAMALAEHTDVQLFDLSPVKTWMAQHNVRELTGKTCPAAAVDVTTLQLRDVPFHIDPDRRAAGKRLQTLDDYKPGPAFIADLLTRSPDGCVKLGPGVDLTSLPVGEIEMISRRGTLVQAVLWTGKLRRAARTATMLTPSPAFAGEGRGEGITNNASPQSRASIITLTGSPARLRLSAAEKYIFTVDPALERAELIGNLADSLNIAAIHPSLGLVTSNRLVDSPWLTPFELLEQLPFRPDKIKAWLKAHDGGIVEVKTRGKSADADDTARQLRGEGATTYTLFVLRFDREIQAWITQRCV